MVRRCKVGVKWVIEDSQSSEYSWPLATDWSVVRVEFVCNIERTAQDRFSKVFKNEARRIQLYKPQKAFPCVYQLCFSNRGAPPNGIDCMSRRGAKKGQIDNHREEIRSSKSVAAADESIERVDAVTVMWKSWMNGENVDWLRPMRKKFFKRTMNTLGGY